MLEEGDKVIFESKAEFDAYNQKMTEDLEVKIKTRQNVPGAAGGSAVIKVGETNPWKAYTDNVKGVAVGRLLRFNAIATRLHGGDVLKVATEAFKLSGADIDGQIVKALTAASAVSAGNLIHETFANEIIELLRITAVVRSMAGIRFVPIPNGQITFDKITVGSTVAYRNETGNANISDLQTGQVKLSAKELVGIAAISQKLLKYSDYAVDLIIRDDLLAGMAEREDLAFIRGDGSSDTPTGLRNLANAAHILDLSSSGTAPTLATVKATLAQMRLKIKQAKIPIRNLGWLLSPRIEEFLMSLVDGNGNPVYEKEMVERGTVGNVPYKMSLQIPENLSGSGFADGTEIYLVEASNVMIGDAEEVNVEVIPNAAYDNGSGTVISGLSKLQDVVRTVSSHDIGVRHDKTIVVGNKVRWTP
jgi:HK97 family phage major capsid protein